MKRLLIIPILLGLFGCVQSLQPYYKDSQLFYDPNLVGKWTDADQQNTIVVTGDSDKKQYGVVLTDEKGKVGRFIMHLAKVQDRMIADIYPDELQEKDINASDEYVMHLLPVHSFMIVDYSPPDLKIRQMDFDWFKKYLLAHRDEVGFQKLQGDHYLLTAPTEEVQTFVLKHLSERGAYGDAQDVIRIPATQP